MIWPGPAVVPRLAEFQPLDAGRLLAVLADGMGGHIGGSTASLLACEAFIAAFTGAQGNIVPRLHHALDQANAAIARKVDERPMFSGMGSTLVGAHFGPEGLEWVSVGDSPLYLYRSGAITLINEDHSMAPEIDRLAEAGRITWEMARNDPRRHYLRSAVTGGEMELIDLSRQPLELVAGDVVILASDGIHTLPMQRIASELRVLEGERDLSLTAERICARLISAVEEARETYQDNTTVVVVRVE